MRDLVALKIKILLAPGGGALYPDFNAIPTAIRQNMDWTKYVDSYGTGWYYDKTCGHKEDSIDSPHGMQWGMLLVPKDFADEVLAKFPLTVTKLSDAEAETFYNTKVTAKEPDEIFNLEVLQGIKLKQDLNLPLTPEQTKAIDPADDTLGITKNKKKLFTDLKTTIGVAIKAI